MALKLTGEFECIECKRPIKVDLDTDLYNFQEKRCPYCKTWNIISVKINDE